VRAGNWQELPPADTRLYRQCVIRRRYTCLACGRSHDAAQLQCSCDGSAGPFIYPILEGLRGRGFIVFRDLGRQVEYRHHDCPSLRLGPDTVAIRDGESAEVFRFEMAWGTWRRSGTRLSPYHPVEHDTHVLVV
jgi:hypothetical protein